MTSEQGVGSRDGPATRLDAAALRAWPLPQPAEGDSKNERGRTLIVAGSREIPGAALLAGRAALRAGSGKLVLATAASVAPGLALALPEARVIALPETDSGALADAGIELLAPLVGMVDAVLLGPGLMDEDGCQPLLRRVCEAFAALPIVLDAAAMAQVLPDAAPGGAQRAGARLITPHAGEMSHLTGVPKEAIDADPESHALRAAAAWGSVVALKGAVTCIATPGPSAGASVAARAGRLWRHEGGHIGLATSGSGDVLAGLVAGLAARGAPLEQAAAWGVVLHAHAGTALARRIGPLGFMAGELADEVPALMHALMHALRHSPREQADLPP